MKMNDSTRTRAVLFDLDGTLLDTAMDMGDSPAGLLEWLPRPVAR